MQLQERQMKIRKFYLRMHIKSHIVSKLIKISNIIISAFGIRTKAIKTVIQFIEKILKFYIERKILTSLSRTHLIEFRSYIILNLSKYPVLLFLRLKLEQKQ